MIPGFDDNGYLPPGVHPATLEEIAQRFGEESEIRQAEMQSLRWLVDLVRRAGIKRLVINGTFVTDVVEPNDVDCALLVDLNSPADPKTERELAAGFPFLDIQLANQAAFDGLIGRIFATDRDYVPKGMVEVIL